MLEFGLEIRDQHDLRHERIGEGNITLAFDEKIMEVKMECVKPLEQWCFCHFVQANDEVRQHAADNAPAKRAHRVDVARVGKQ